jgi:hypothetical protein
VNSANFRFTEFYEVRAAAIERQRAEQRVEEVREAERSSKGRRKDQNC